MSTMRYLRARYGVSDEAADAARVALLVYRLRSDAGLTQRQLAARVGTTASVICRLESSDYGGHSLSMLRRVAAAVGKRVVVRFELEDAGPPRRAAGG